MEIIRADGTTVERINRTLIKSKNNDEYCGEGYSYILLSKVVDLDDYTIDIDTIRDWSIFDDIQILYESIYYFVESNIIDLRGYVIINKPDKSMSIKSFYEFMKGCEENNVVFYDNNNTFAKTFENEIEEDDNEIEYNGISDLLKSFNVY